MVGVCREEAVAWVQKNRGMICKKIFSFFPRCLQQDVDEFVRDAYVIAIEAAVKAERKGLAFEAVFWTDFVSLLKGSQVFYFESPDPLDADAPYNIHALTTEDPLADLSIRFHREQLISKTVACIQRILSPAEQRIFLLFMGETEHGFCSLGEAARILGIAKGSAQKLAERIEKKITDAAKIINVSKGLFGFDWEEMSRAVRGGKGRFSSVSAAVLKELFLRGNEAKPALEADEDLQVAV